jgi:O-antigen ligase
VTAAVGRLRREGLTLVAIAAATVAIIAADAALPSHQTYAMAVIGLAAVVVCAFVFSAAIPAILVWWVALEGVAYPFLRYPLGHNLVTFDRLVLLGLGAALLIVPSTRLSGWPRHLARALLLFTVLYGVRAFTTQRLLMPPGYPPQAGLQPYATWVDNVVLPAIVFVAAARWVTRSVWDRVVVGFLVLGVSVALLGIFEWATGSELASLSHGEQFIDISGITRVSGPYQTNSAYGAVLLFCIAVTAYWMHVRHRLAAGLAILAIELLGVAPTFTKTIWISVIATILVAFGLRRGISGRTLLTVVVVGLIVAFGYSALKTNPIIQERVTSRDASDNVASRLASYHEGWLIFRHWPVYGVGIDQYIPAQQLVPAVYVNGVRAAFSPHNSFISVLAETGLAGFAALVLVLVSAGGMLRAYWRQAGTDEERTFVVAVCAAALGYLLYSQTLAAIKTPPSMTFLMLLLGCVAGRMRSRDVVSDVHP